MSCVVTREPHRLVSIFTSNGEFPGHRRVVRWCQDCGSVVIDDDVDGRTQPGGSMAMRAPKLALAAASSAGNAGVQQPDGSQPK